MTDGEIRIGCDVAIPDDIADSIANFGERYLDRIFTATERAESGDDPQRLAARFAAKEAVIKLIRPSATDVIAPIDVAIVHDAVGAPTVVLSERAARLAQNAGLGPIAVSISHERTVAFGTAVSRIAVSRTLPARSRRGFVHTLVTWIKHLLPAPDRRPGSLPARTTPTSSSRPSDGRSTRTDG